MKVKRFEWEGPRATARELRLWTLEAWADVDEDVNRIENGLTEAEDKDRAMLALTAHFDATETPRLSLAVGSAELDEALAGLDLALRESLEVAAENIRTVAEAQVDAACREVALPQGQVVTVREVPVGAAGIYAPGGRAAYPSSVLMCAIPAQVAGVERIALATPPGPDGEVNPVVLATAALCGLTEVYAMGGAQAIFSLAYGTETIDSVDVVAGPGNAWVREAKRRVSVVAGIDSLAGPSELMLIPGHDTDPAWAAADLCAQAEHGADSPLVVAAVEERVLDAIAEATERLAASHPGVSDARLATVQVPDTSAAVELANEFHPEHLQLMEEDAAPLAAEVTTAGCVLAGRYSATAFGDYVAGSNHVLPTSGAGRFSGPLGPHVFRRKIATVEVTADAAAKLAPHVDRIARAEGFPVHGESAMIRTER